MGIRARVAGGNQGAVGPVSQSEEFSNMTERGEPNTAAETRGRAQRCMDFCEGPLYFLPEQFQGGGRSQSAGCEDGNGGEGLQTVLLQRENSGRKNARSSQRKEHIQ